MDVLSALPRDIDHIHHILFTLPMPFSLSTANHELFWPLIDNAYSIRKSYDVGFRKRDARLAKITKLTIRPKYSLSGIVSLIAQCGEQYDARARKAAYDWSRKKLSATLEHPWLDAFPYHVQLLLLEELKQVELLAEAGADSNLSESGKCDCRFARSYWLPCRHVIYAFETLGEIEEPN
jgi:hypothetical protein